MDIRGCVFAVILVLNFICLSFIAASSDPETERYGLENFGGVHSLRGPELARKLREDIVRELEDLKVLETQLMGHFNLIQEKKRQLEIKKRQPVQCLVNIVSCWKRK